MTPTGNANVTVPLSELNQIIAEQKGVTIDQLAVTDGINPNPKTSKKVEAEINAVIEQDDVSVDTEDMSPAQLRSKADALFKQAQALRKQADTIDPPKSKKKDVVDADAS